MITRGVESGTNCISQESKGSNFGWPVSLLSPWFFGWLDAKSGQTWCDKSAPWPGRQPVQAPTRFNRNRGVWLGPPKGMAGAWRRPDLLRASMSCIASVSVCHTVCRWRPPGTGSRIGLCLGEPVGSLWALRRPGRNRIHTSHTKLMIPQRGHTVEETTHMSRCTTVASRKTEIPSESPGPPSRPTENIPSKIPQHRVRWMCGSKLAGNAQHEVRRASRVSALVHVPATSHG